MQKKYAFTLSFFLFIACSPTPRTSVLFRKDVLYMDIKEIEKPGINPQLIVKGTISQIETVKTECKKAIKELSPFSVSDMKKFETVLGPNYIVKPKQITFYISVTNNLDHVIRLDPKLIRLKLNNKILKRDFNDLNVLFAPGETEKFQIPGPNIEYLKNNDILYLSLFDLVTKTDDAGNPTERSHFNWKYKIQIQRKSIEEHLPVTVQWLPHDITLKHCVTVSEQNMKNDSIFLSPSVEEL